MKFPTALAIHVVALVVSVSGSASAHTSVARIWNEAALESIRNDIARPTVHARNLWHTAMAMYDAWAIFDDTAAPYFMGNRIGGYQSALYGIEIPTDRKAAQEEAISYAAYRVLAHRFLLAPASARDETQQRLRDQMLALGYDPDFTSTDYRDGSPAALGNAIAAQIIEFGLGDGANEPGIYASRHYEPINPGINPNDPGNPDIVDVNRWQPLALPRFVGQGKFETTTDFVGPEWGSVVPFALSRDSRSTFRRDGHDYFVYHDPGQPPLLYPQTANGSSESYQWGFALVASWSGHLDPGDGILWDISPASMGQVADLPLDPGDYAGFYDFFEGGDPGAGHAMNPHTGQPYEPNVVPRGDYARVLAEFWADGPDSETPPGHWFVILNYVHDQPDFERRYRGIGPELDPLEWDVKAYFALGGAMHDAAVTAWGIKGWYDYIRPVSAIRCMADMGQSSDPGAPNHHPGGLPLVDGIIEMVGAGDPLAGENGENVGKLKLWGWLGPTRIEDPEVDQAGVGWILAEEWWPYQRPNFVTPPFAGYVSGHSTYSRAAAEVLTYITGDPFFPGGMGEFVAPRNEFLVFEEGPSVDVHLQWATYRDASDQTSLSRIWGGIHPPADDIPGRRIGIRVGLDAVAYAEKFFEGGIEPTSASVLSTVLYPNPARVGQLMALQLASPLSTSATVEIFDVRGRRVMREVHHPWGEVRFLPVDAPGVGSGVYFVRVATPTGTTTSKLVLIR